MSEKCTNYKPRYCNYRCTSASKCPPPYPGGWAVFDRDRACFLTEEQKEKLHRGGPDDATTYKE